MANEVFEAARSGHATRLSKLLASSPAVAWGDISDGGTGTTVLAVAAKGGHAKCVALLLNCEGKPNIRAADSFGQATLTLPNWALTLTRTLSITLTLT